MKASQFIGNNRHCVHVIAFNACMCIFTLSYADTLHVSFVDFLTCNLPRMLCRGLISLCFVFFSHLISHSLIFIFHLLHVKLSFLIQLSCMQFFINCTWACSFLFDLWSTSFSSLFLHVVWLVVGLIIEKLLLSVCGA